MRRGNSYKNRFEALKSRVGTFLAEDVEKSYQYDSKAEFLIEVRKKNDNSIFVDKVFFLGETKIHCQQTIVLDSQRQFDHLVVFANEVNLYYSDDDKPQVFVLPVTMDDLESFVESGGMIDLDDNTERKLTVKDWGYQFTAVGNKITQGNDEVGLTFENEIDALFKNMILFKDGTLKCYPNSLSGLYLTTKRQERNESRMNFLRQLEGFDKEKFTKDGFNVKKLFEDIDGYLLEKFQFYQQQRTYDALTEMLIQYNTDPSQLTTLAQTKEKIQASLQTRKDLAIGIICLIGATALLGLTVGFALLMALVFPGALFLPTFAAISFTAALWLGVYGGFKIHEVRLGFEYDKNISRLTQFFQPPKQDVVQLDPSLQVVDVLPNAVENGDIEFGSLATLEEQKGELGSPANLEEQNDKLRYPTYGYDFSGTVIELY